MLSYKGINYLEKKLNKKRERVKTRYKYYEMKNSFQDFDISTPRKLRNVKSVLGWCAKGVDALADRLTFREFKNDAFNVNQIFQLNNPDIFFDSAILSALISSCCFVYISTGEDGNPRLQVIDGGNATGVIDPITGLLTEGYAVLERGDRGEPVVYAYFTAESTTVCDENKENKIIETHDVGYPLLVPIIHRPDPVRPFGHSRISRACINLLQGATRTVKRSEISAEFYSFPQKYIIGLSAGENEDLDNQKAAMSSMLSIAGDDDGETIKVGQFAQQSMEPHVEQLKMFASLFAGETGLTTDDLGFPTENPSSSEAIKSAHENLRLSARAAQRTFGSGFLNVAFLAACLRDKYHYNREAFCKLEPLWKPIFEPDSGSLASLGDGIIKINNAIPNYIDKETIYELTGIEPNKLEEEVTGFEVEEDEEKEHGKQ